jgi:hypothetical protein
MHVRRVSGANPPVGHRPRRLAAGLVTLLAVLLSTASATGTAVAAPASGPPGGSKTTGGSGGTSGDRITWSVQASGRTRPDTRPTFSYAAVPAGTSRADHIAIRNLGSGPLTLQVYASDARNTSTGGFDLLPAARRPVDVGSWVHLTKSRVTVRAHSTVIVPFTVTVPANATPGFHVGGIVASSSGTAHDAKGDLVRVDRRVGMRVFLQVAGPLRPGLAVRHLTVRYKGGWDPIHPGTATVGYTVTNTGNVPLQAHRAVRTGGLFGVFGKVTRQADVPLLLPGNSIRLTARLTGVWPGGTLHTEVSLKPFTSVVALAPPPAAATATATTGAVPWTWLITALAVLAALGLWAGRRRRRGAGAAGAAAREHEVPAPAAR